MFASYSLACFLLVQDIFIPTWKFSFNNFMNVPEHEHTDVSCIKRCFRSVLWPPVLIIQTLWKSMFHFGIAVGSKYYITCVTIARDWSQSKVWIRAITNIENRVFIANRNKILHHSVNSDSNINHAMTYPVMFNLCNFLFFGCLICYGTQQRGKYTHLAVQLKARLQWFKSAITVGAMKKKMNQG